MIAAAAQNGEVPFDSRSCKAYALIGRNKVRNIESHLHRCLVLLGFCCLGCILDELNGKEIHFCCFASATISYLQSAAPYKQNHSVHDARLTIRIHSSTGFTDLKYEWVLNRNQNRTITFVLFDTPFIHISHTLSCLLSNGSCDGCDVTFVSTSRLCKDGVTFARCNAYS